MNGNALARFIDQAVDYDDWRTPLDPRLQQAVIVSGISLVMVLLNLLLVPALLEWTYSEYFLFGADLLRGTLYAMYQMQPWLLGLVITSLVVYGALLYFTDQLEAGSARWHNVATAEVILGSISGFVLGLEVLLIVLNLIAWIAIIIIGIAVLIAVLAGMASAS